MGENHSLDDPPVPGRECGRCTVCCKTPKINVPELKKFAAVLCNHCTEGVGCKIYEARPSVCRGWYCGWRRLPGLGEHWRPDRCGVLIDVVDQGIPAGFPPVGLKFDVVDSPSVLTWYPLIKYIGSEIERGMPVFLGVPAPIGYERRKIFLNYLMAEAVASHDRMRIIDGLVSAYEMGGAGRQEGKNHVRLGLSHRRLRSHYLLVREGARKFYRLLQLERIARAEGAMPSRWLLARTISIRSTLI
jgi:hypothetical protein